ncbi:MAG: hypothetical protein ACAI38_03800, partial [Myxococcota bacterium]
AVVSGHTMQRAGTVEAPFASPAVQPDRYPRAVQRILDTVNRAAGLVLIPKATSRLLLKADNAKARTAIFAVESLMRGLEDRFDGRYKPERELAKSLEDGLGHLVDAQTNHSLMQRLGQRDLRAYWAAIMREKRRDLRTLLRTEWLPRTAGADKGFGHLANAVKNEKHLVVAEKDGHVLSAEEDCAANAKMLRREAKQLFEKEGEFDFTDVDSIHELRRTCRWFAIAARALNGAVLLVDGGEPKRFTHYLTDPASKGEFADLPKSDRECQPVRVSRALWIGIGDVIDKLGKIKDEGEQYLAVKTALMGKRELKEKAAHREALRILGWDQSTYDGWTRGAEALHAEAKDLFKALCKQLKAQQ